MKIINILTDKLLEVCLEDVLDLELFSNLKLGNHCVFKTTWAIKLYGFKGFGTNVYKLM